MTKDDFIFDGEYAMRIVDKKGLLAFFSVIYAPLGIEFKDNALRNGQKGAFVSPPAREYQDKKGETKYSKYWSPTYDRTNNVWSEAGMAFQDAMREAAIEEYERRKAGKSGTGNATSGRSAGGAKKSGRGPVGAPVVEDFGGGPDDPFGF